MLFRSQAQGEITKPDLGVPRAPLRKATGAATAATENAQSGVGAARDTISSTRATAAGEAGGAVAATSRSAHASGGAFAAGGASMGSASFGAGTSAEANARAGY